MSFSKLIVAMFFMSTLFIQKSIGSEGSTYQFKWLDPDKEVFVLQNRKYRKKGRLYLSLGGGITTSGPFTDATVLQGRAGYFIGEEWGIELLFSKNNNKTNDTFEGVRRVAQVVPFVRQTTNYLGGMLLWSPFYAKINTFNSIIYFDWIFGLGAASISEENNQTSLGTNTFENLREETHSALMWDVGMQFYLGQNWAIRLDFTAAHYNAPEALQTSLSSEEDINSNYDLTLALAVRF